MNKERLLKLADHLENVVAKQPETFDMDYFGVQRRCGTVCCALGHAASVPEFQRDGLILQWHPLYESEGVSQRADVVFFKDGESYLGGFEAAEAFFGLDEEQSPLLFGGDDVDENGRKLTPHDVAARIRDLVASQP